MKFSAHSNIALIKYWGKHGHQLPSNPSISFSLKKCQTIMSFAKTPSEEFKLEFFFEDQRNLSFEKKIQEKLKKTSLNLSSFHLKIKSENTFPHSCGIASSASSMACFAKILDNTLNLELDSKSLSSLAREFSGSACRSIKSGAQSWGEVDYIEGSSDKYASFVKIHERFHNLRDTIIVVDSSEKKVSSTLGHSLMNKHSFASARFNQAREHHQQMVEALRTGDWDTFSSLTIHEAWVLHSLMQSADPSFCLLRPDTLKMIEALNDQLNIPFTYTMDAGPNIHLIYEDKYHQDVLNFLEVHRFYESIIEDEVSYE